VGLENNHYTHKNIERYTMTTKSVSIKKKTPPANQDKQTESEKYAKVSLSPATMSAVLSEAFTNQLFPDTNLADVANALRDRITNIQNGDMKSIEAMLIGQAQALQTIFVSLGRMAASKTQLAQYTAFMNMALKAQSQSRSTIQALIELKYPKQIAFVKQANIANGHQQVNNGTNPQSSINDTNASRVEKSQNRPNELLEVSNGSTTMDIRATQTAGRKNKEMATMEIQHRRKNT